MTDNKRELNDRELSEANGAGISEWWNDMFPSGSLRNSKGQACGWYSSGKLKYRPCDKCGKPTHCGLEGMTKGVFFCDPCNEHYYVPSLVVWNGSKDDLAAASM